MKRTCVISLFLVLLLLLTGCVSSGGRYRTFLCISMQDERSFSMEYNSFDGKKYYVFSPRADTTLRMRFETKSGALSCSVLEKSSMDEVFSAKDIQTGENEVALK
ncbi:MAG: hypothetical protein IJL26_01210, partial [Clostridia bacterium]|nr:hypothetical protein [Clostridia bacterium]